LYTFIRKNNVHIIVSVVALFVYSITVVATLLMDQYICNRFSLLICLGTAGFIAFGSFVVFIRAIVKRSIKNGIHAAYMAFLASALYGFTYLLAIQCPGW
jgi:hypothetical protein